MISTVSFMYSRLTPLSCLSCLSLSLSLSERVCIGLASAPQPPLQWRSNCSLSHTAEEDEEE